MVQKRGNAAINREAIQNPEFVDIESLDMFSNFYFILAMPHFQQTRL